MMHLLFLMQQSESSSKAQHDKKYSTRSLPLSPLTEEETQLIGNFADTTLNLIRRYSLLI